jgi:predicted transcriptional regulator
MSSTLTIRLPAAQRDALKRRASALNKTESALIRELVEREVSEPDWTEMVSQLAGSIDSNADTGIKHPLHDYVHAQNWRS